MPLGECMQLIEKQLRFHFSYKADIITLERKVNMDKSNRPLREILFVLFPVGIHWKEKGQYIILSKKKSEKDIVVAGYIEDANGQSVKGATVYDARTLASANSNEFGYYEMRIERSEKPVQLEARKISYNDTLSPIIPSAGGLQNIVMSEKKKNNSDFSWKMMGDSLKAGFDSVRTDIGIWTNQLFAGRTELKNVSDTLHRNFQFSFVPFVGTNGQMSGHVINDVSMNLIGGYSLGTRAFEMAGLFNAVRGEVSGVQVAGLFNANGGDQDGVQLSGFANLSGGKQRGMQVAGFANISSGSAEGVRMAGFANMATERVDGLALAGFANISTKDSRGFAASGFANVAAGSLDGMQITGFANIVSGNSKGMQVAGFANITGRSHHGIQMAGFVNIADTVKGMQIGLINLSRSIKGIPIGFFSFSKTGYWGVDVGYHQAGWIELQWRTGVDAFYTIFSGGLHPSEFATDFNPMRWSMGYGVGTYLPFGKKARLAIELSAHHISEGRMFKNLSLDQRLLAALEINLSKQWMIYAGPQFHSYASEKAVGGAYNYAQVGWMDISNWQTDKFLFENWLGWKVGLRFRNNQSN